MVFNATFNNISSVAVSFIGGGNQCTQRNPLTCRKLLTMLHQVHLAMSGIQLTTLVVITTDCKSNYHMITTTTAPLWKELSSSYVEQVKYATLF